MKKNKKLIVPACLVAILLLATSAYFVFIRDNQGSDQFTSNDDNINYEPPTEDEIQQAENNKEELGNQVSGTPERTGSGKIAVVPIISTASPTFVSGFVPGVFEEGGICKYEFSNDSQTFTKTSSGFGNVNNTQCEPLQLSNSDFPSNGSWNIVLNYSSTTAEGQSNASTISL